MSASASRSIGFIVLKPDGHVSEQSRILNAKFVLGETIPIIYLRGSVETKGKGSIERLHQYTHGNHIIHIYGWKKGADNIMNTHSLPKPLDNMELYGDILVFSTCAIETEIFVSITENDYIEFFNTMYEQTEDIDENHEIDEEHEEEENAEDDDNVDDDEEELNTEDHEDHCIEIVMFDGELQIEPEYFETTPV
jgi:hypothetical protein